MPFEGSAIARSISAEYIAAARERSSSAGQDQAPSTYNTNGQPRLFISPSPIYATPRNDDEHYRRARSPSSPRRPGRTSSGMSGILGGRRQNDPIPESQDEHAPAPAAQASAVPVPARSGSDSDHTLAADRDVEAANADDDEDRYPIVGEPVYIAQKREEAKRAQLEAEARKKHHEKEKEKQESKPEEKKKEDPYLVTLKGRENLNPHTWNVAYRWALTGLAGLLVLNSTFASSGPSQLLPSMEQYFGFSSEVGTLTIALFVAGYTVGPLLWGPLSERIGRKPVLIISFVPYIGFQVGCALSKNTGSILVFRFLGGCFASSPLTTSGGIIADLWDADRRGIALAIFSLAPFMGPALAPLVSGAFQVRGIDWRWMFWVLTIFAGVCLAAIVFLLPETYVPYLLHKEAKKIRKETGDERYHSANEHPDHKVTLSETLHHTILKPFIMIVQEPMLLFLTLYLSFVYGIVYLLFEALPIIFQEKRGFNALEGGLVFLALPVGGFTATMVYALYFNKVYIRKHKALKPGQKMVAPEERLKVLMLAAPLFALSFFWLGWTYYPSISAASPILAVVLLGFCVLLLFLGVFNYIIDSYLAAASSALAINTVMRSTFGAGFPLFATQMYNKLGVPGACSLLGGLAIVFMPLPFLLFKYGRKVRMMSKNAAVID